MSYFSKFPRMVYTLDEYKTGQVLPDIFRRTKFLSDLTNSFAFFDEYDVKDGETPEIVADLFYNEPTLHWVILQANEIVDPRFDWPLSTYNLQQFVEGRYNNVNAIHHYIDSDGYQTNANLLLQSSAEFSSLSVGDVLKNTTNSGNAYVTVKTSSSLINIVVSDGGFQTGDVVELVSNSSISANITSTTIVSGIAVTNFDFENTQNETKRRIKIIKPEIVADIINEFESTINR